MGTSFVFEDSGDKRGSDEAALCFTSWGKGLVYELYFDNCLVGSQLAIGNDSMLITLKTTYNEAYKEYSPGKVLDYLTLKQEFELGRYSKIEFCTNAGPELMRWGNRTRPISHVTIYRSKFSQRLALAYRKIKGVGASLLRLFGFGSG